MKALFNAKERDLDDWNSLLLKADSRFKIQRVNKLASSPLALIEVSWATLKDERSEQYNT